MSTRLDPGCAAAAAAACLFAIVALSLALTGPALAQPVEEAREEAGMLAWLGCWQPVAEHEESSQESPEARQMVCLKSGDGPNSLTRTLIVDDQVVAERTLVGDGSRQLIRAGGCDGWERTLRSADGRRLYLQSETTCEGGNLRKLSGASMMVSGDRWIEIHVVRVDREREIMIREHRAVSGNTAWPPGELPTAVHTARLAATAQLTAADVIEALEHVDPAVVEAMLQESKPSFAMDSHLLLRLADAEVPDAIIDLMVALSFPEYFAVDDDTAAPDPALYSSFWSPWFSPYGYGYGYYPPYHYHPHPPVVGPPRPRGGRVISGHGYTRVRPTRVPSGGIAALLQRGTGGDTGAGSGTGGDVSAGSSSDTGGTVSKSGHSSGSPNSTRKAIRRDEY
jgi:hypothetical protein